MKPNRQRMGPEPGTAYRDEAFNLDDFHYENGNLFHLFCELTHRFGTLAFALASDEGQDKIVTVGVGPYEHRFIIRSAPALQYQVFLHLQELAFNNINTATVRRIDSNRAERRRILASLQEERYFLMTQFNGLKAKLAENTERFRRIDATPRAVKPD